MPLGVPVTASAIGLPLAVGPLAPAAGQLLLRRVRVSATATATASGSARKGLSLQVCATGSARCTGTATQCHNATVPLALPLALL